VGRVVGITAKVGAGARWVGGKLSRSHDSAFDRPGRMRVERSLQIMCKTFSVF
jgi:hypothetical protein